MMELKTTSLRNEACRLELNAQFASRHGTSLMFVGGLLLG